MDIVRDFNSKAVQHKFSFSDSVRVYIEEMEQNVKIIVALDKVIKDNQANEYAYAKRNELVEWFSAQKKEVEIIFEPYLQVNP